MNNTRFDNFLNEMSATAKTALQEAGHAISFGIRQLKNGDITVEDILNQDLFYKSYRRYADIDSSPEEVYQFLIDEPKWAKSIATATNALYKSGVMKKNSYVIYRGTGFMNGIYNEFNRLKRMSDIKEVKKMNNDKWNPGDVWASVDPVIPSFSSIIELNKWVSNGIKKGYVIPISLKKVGRKARVVIERFEKNPELVGYRKIKSPKEIFSTGINVITTKKPYAINFRSFRILRRVPITGELIEVGGSARHGKVGRQDLVKILGKYNIPQMSKKRISELSEQQLIQNVVNLWGQCGYKYNKNKIERDYAVRKKSIQDWVGYWMSIINALEIGAYLNTHKSQANDIVNTLYYSAKSLTQFSSDRVKVY